MAAAGRPWTPIGSRLTCARDCRRAGAASAGMLQRRHLFFRVAVGRSLSASREAQQFGRGRLFRPSSGVLRNIVLVALTVVLSAEAAAQRVPPCAQTGFEKITALQGTWDVEWSNRISPGHFEQTVAHSQIEATIPQCVLVERFSGTVRGRPFWATGLITVSPGSIQRVWVDSEHGEPLLFHGQWAVDTLTFEWERNLGERKIRLRHLYIDVGNSSFHTLTYLATSVGAPWELVSEARYHRAKR